MSNKDVSSSKNKEHYVDLDSASESESAEIRVSGSEVLASRSSIDIQSTEDFSKIYREAAYSKERKTDVLSASGVFRGIRPRMQTGGVITTDEEVPHRPIKNINLCSAGNLIWVFLFGWWLSLAYGIATVILYISIVGRPYAVISRRLASYFFWPFGKYIVEKTVASDQSIYLQNLEDTERLIPKYPRKTSLFARIVWYSIFGILLFPLTLIAMCVNWLLVASIPMSKSLKNIIFFLATKPTCIDIVDDYSKIGKHLIISWNGKAFSYIWLFYNVRGCNIVFLNLIPLIALRVILILINFFYSIDEYIFNPVVQFFINLISTMPITFFIGMSIECIAAQTNYAVGAILNATFGSLTELLLFTIAINKGELGELIVFSLTGSFLCDLLFLPGLSMICGGIKYKEQNLNTRASGVSSLLLFIAVFGAYTPTIFYRVFGEYKQSCDSCKTHLINNETQLICTQCVYYQDNYENDPIYTEKVRYILFITTILLPIAYIIGLIFTFKTHTHIFEDEEEDEDKEKAEWSILFSIFVMSLSISCFGLIAEDIVHILDHVLSELGVSQAFMGVTLIALTPAATEIANAVKFALANELSLSIGIGSASAIQVALIQMPCLSIISILFNPAQPNPFQLIFPNVTVFAVILTVLTFNYISSVSKTNYFVGTSLVVIYLIQICCLFYVPSTASSH